MNLYANLAPIAIALLSTAGGILLMATNLRNARTIENVPKVKVRSAAQGYTSLNGFAKLLPDTEPVVAPLTGTRCLWYHYKIEGENNNSKSSDWETLEEGTSEQWLALDDDTGLCHIDPRRADVTAAVRKRWYGSEREPARIAATGIQRKMFNQRYRYTEHRIHANEWLYALGWFETVHAPGREQLAQAQMKTLLNEWKRNRDTLLARFDSNRDGELDLQEWEQARAAAARQARDYATQQPEQPPVNTFSRPPLRDLPYLLATTDHEQLARRYRRNAFFSLVAGFTFAAWVGWRYVIS